ncbi:redoxin domain-containing protein [Pelagicoccus sp. SDUM812003]|uniref:redoxin domain-containing protein n=1 Tax=Pelagicoccus sp. SDUM812003 TaxID=3041267 RepID=UPI00281033D0|nr:redoxin domain-containing protein [Pelagicoccus sp. SDUM812003]MDQ8204734.1 redoxin domain-containing protein [Pelagicoccus sp. SDUM812003]
MKLIPKDKAPSLTVPRMGGGNWSLANQRPETFLLLIFYRGHHCPICKTYLEKLNDLLGDASKQGITVFVASGDTEERARKSWDEWKIDDIDLGYGMTVAQMDEWGLYISSAIAEEEPSVFGEPGLFLIKPDHTIYYGAYNSMPMGRPNINEVIEFVKFIRKEDYPARGEKSIETKLEGSLAISN